VFSGPIEDRLAIRERFDTYSDAVTRQVFDDYLDCWTDDGERFGTGGECHGADELRTHWHGIWKALSQMAFTTQVGAIVIDGATATARSYCLETLQFHGGATRQLVGAYDDELRRDGGVWRFRVRRYRVLIEDTHA
jgi:ketosteroid isomerase-like protein